MMKSLERYLKQIRTVYTTITHCLKETIQAMPVL